MLADLETNIAERLGAAGLTVGPALSRSEGKALRARWRETFAPGWTTWRTGESLPEWHLFSGETLESLQGKQARARYDGSLAGNASQAVLVLSWQLFLPVRGPMPSYDVLRRIVPGDAYVIDTAWAWTIMLTHEEEAMGLGPYFVESV
ncbi:MAG: hypothetical protein HOO96_35605 [Polyangiaceae bacterium]|nr:hypothetical protein [Polyangiaceae bacterium]